MENIIEVVTELNAELFEMEYGEQQFFTYSTDGDVDYISFNGTSLWDSEMDDRVWIEYPVNDYEPFKPYIKRIFNSWVDTLYTLKFKQINGWAEI